MKYNNCPKCKELASAVTIQKVGECNNCKAKRILNKYLSDEKFLLEKTKSRDVGNYTIDLIMFLRKSNLVASQQNRIVIDFLKILKMVDNYDVKLSEQWVQSQYFKVSAIKSLKAANIIKAFLYAKDLIELDIISESFFSVEIRSVYRYEKNILDYFFAPSRCHDCGKYLKHNSHSFCYNCLAYRSIYNRTTMEYVEKNFEQDSVKGLYYNFCAYISFLGRKPQTIASILEHSQVFFYFLAKYIPDNLNTWPFSFTPNDQGTRTQLQLTYVQPLVKFTFSEEWLEIFTQEFKNVNVHFSTFLAFLKAIGLVSSPLKNPQEKLREKIDNVMHGFQTPIFRLLEKESATIELLVRKNTVRTKKWSTVENKIDSIIAFYKWLSNNESVQSWAEVSERMVNMYLLEFPEKSRDIKRRLFFNFFEDARKQRYIFSNPIEQFIARDRMIEVKPLSKKIHAQIYQTLVTATNELYVEKLMSSLIYFHALTTREVVGIRIDDIKLDRNCILIKGRPPAYLSKIEMLMLHLTLTERVHQLNGRSSDYLFCSYSALTDKTVSKNTVLKYVKTLIGLSPKSLRIAALQYCAASFGAEYLHNCIGLSVTQASRYANMGEEFLDEIIDFET
ncbi:hypothetical protein [Priestia megaterium]|uniref:hypothetical protein n=1 Tax=Priestia megaterium TaxID=1404 RepID=UPI003CC6BE12